MQDSENKTENRIVGALVYIIVIITVVMIAPPIYEFAENYSDSRISIVGENAVSGERNTKNKNYTVLENTIDISELRNTDFGALTLITAKVSNSGNLILFCSYRAEINSGQNETPDFAPNQYETRLQIAAIKNPRETDELDADNYYTAKGDIAVYDRTLSVRSNLLESVQSGDYIFTDFGDDTFFISNHKTAFLFDLENMKTATTYAYPSNYNVYHSALSQSKEMLALSTEEGFFIQNLQNQTAAPMNFDLKELISATVNSTGVKMTVRYPFWSSDDSHIFYKLYADENVKNAGVTTTSPGGNEQLAALECSDFLFMADDSIFYYFSSATGITGMSPGILFRCGYFNINERKMTDIMKSQVYYFDVDISQSGTLLAALSYNGNLIKISIIDIRTKKLIYSCLYSEIYDFSFSPDEKNVVVYGRENGRRTLKTVKIDWMEE